MDKTGKADPYVKFKINGKKAKSKKLKRTLNPVWKENNEFSLQIVDIENDVLEVVVMDWDRFSRNDLMGATTVPLKYVRDHGNQVDEMFSLENPKSKKPCGEVHLRISVDDGHDKSLGKGTVRRRKSCLEREEVKLDTVSCCIGTWNVGNEPPPDDLSDWIPKDGYDIFVLGTQECEYKPREGFETCRDDWIACLTRHFGDKYFKVRDITLLEIRLAVYATKDVRKLIKNEDTSKEATGLAGVYGNKGGTAVSFDILGTRVCFVNSHLAAHQDRVAGRNQNYSEIVGGVNVGVAKQDFLNQFHHVFWIGDLNYRINLPDQDEKEREPTKEIFDKITGQIDKEEWADLFQYDQLLKQMQEKAAFVGFQEGHYDFKPTFKVKRKKEVEYTEKRTPSWCDRILWRDAPGCQIQQNSLEGCFDVETSDHKPVRSCFTIPIIPAAVPGGKTTKAKIEIVDLKGKDLLAADPNGKSDPSVVFVKHGFVKNQVKTSVCHKTLNPVWEDTYYIDLYVNADVHNLLYSLLLIRVMDYDKVSADDAIGQGMLGLCHAMGKRGEFVEFNLDLTHKGLRAGTLSGKYKLTILDDS